ncbi:GntR family transcriptional regulator [Paenibacillus sp. 1P07SE]|uniref:GntR family transcriptional regulator n=1 Tax=Paenibacillus sp. 1P07SE TaxID=3132209 RepID=UPI0039A71B69
MGAIRGSQLSEPAISISEHVYRSLKQDILTGDMPPGVRLIVTEIGRRFSISQAPVREALERLKQEGLIVGIPNKGSVVSSITAKEIRDIFVLRELIECFAVRQIIGTLTVEDYRTLESLITEMDLASRVREPFRILELDMDFHEFFYMKCGNQAILELWGRLRTKVMRFMAISNRHHSTDKLAEWHTKLVETLKAGDPLLAEQAFIEHMHAYKMISIDE